MRKALRIPAGIVAALAIFAAGGIAWSWFELRASLPDYSGIVALEGLDSPVVVERDSLGVVTIAAANRLDEARAMGYVHAQERFFQMDLLRRSAAGELAALVGEVAIARDRQRRVHQLRQTAERVVGRASREDLDLLEAYAAGVNAGLGALEARPFEYLVLRQTPEPWSPVDSVLVMGAMYFNLQDPTASAKRSEIVARQVLPDSIADLLYPTATPWDAPLIGSPGPAAAIPPAAVYDLRRLGPEALATLERAPERIDLESLRPPAGSNNWAVGGGRTATGRALVANDPHLELQTPAIWFRASLVRATRRVTGATLPGLPAVVLGSNESVSWGLTNSEGDWTDLVVLDPDPEDPARYRTPNGSLLPETVSSPIEVAGGDPVDFTFERTIFGPVIGALPDGRRLAVHWVAHEPRAYALRYWDLADAASLEDAFTIVQSSGMPAQNFVAADRSGNLGWTIAGPIPRRLRATRWSTSSEGPAWNGWLDASEYPRVVDPEDGLIWTANARVVDGEMLAAIGNTEYALGARAGQIRDRLERLDRATTGDMLRIQLDDEARFLSRWRDALLELLEDESDPLLIAVRDAVRDSSGRADVDSVGYRIVRSWRIRLVERMLLALAAPARAIDPEWGYSILRHEYWAWPLVEQEPPQLLDPRFESWRAFELDVLNEYLRASLDVGTPSDLAARTWGDFNTIRVRHPLSRAVPFLSRWLDMPATALPGDAMMPRVQQREHGASARFAVSPGDEASGYFHMPGGQSGHPLSPYHGAGHEDWALGRPAPFLPGAPERRLELVAAAH